MSTSSTPLRLFDPLGADPAWDPSRPLVGAVIDLYLAAKAREAGAGLCEPERLDNLKRYLSSFRYRFGGTLVADARSSDLTAWLSENPTWRSPSTLACAVGCVVACFRWAADERLVATCPYSRRNLHLPAEQPRRPISEPQYRALMGHARAHKRGSRKSRTALRLGVYFLWQTGCRTSEMRAAEWSWVDWERGVLDPGGEHKTARKGHRRLIPLPARVLRLLALLQRRGRTEGQIFRNGQGRPWTKGSFGTLFRKYARRAGVPAGLSAYCLRHGFVCKGLEAGVGERQLADVVGHARTDKIAWYGKAMKGKADYLKATLSQVHGKKPRTQGAKARQEQRPADPPAPPAVPALGADADTWDCFRKLALIDSAAAAALARFNLGEVTRDQAMLSWLRGS